MNIYNEIYYMLGLIFQGFLPFLSFLLSLGTLAVAIVGLSTWRRQMEGNFNFKLARKINISGYMFRDAIQSTRVPWVLGDKREEYSRRWDATQNAAYRLKSDLLEAQVVWDKDEAIKIVNEIDRIKDELFGVIHSYLASIDAKNRKDYKLADELWSIEKEKILYAGIDREYDNKVEDLILHIEKFVKPRLHK